MYFEFDGHAVDPPRLADAVARLWERHPVLRTAFPNPVGETAPSNDSAPRPVVQDLSTTEEPVRRARLLRTREQMSSQRLKVHRGEVLDVRLSLLPDAKTRLHIDVDLVAADPPSITILLSDLADFYQGGPELAPLQHDFATYRRTHPDAPADADLTAWHQRLHGRNLAPPLLDLAADPMTTTGAGFNRRDLLVPTARWRRIERKARAERIAPEAVLLAAYAHTLGRFGSNKDFLLVFPAFDRPTPPPDIRRVVGDFTRLLLVGADVSGPVSLRQLAHMFHQERLTAKSPVFASGATAVRDVARGRGENPPLLGAVYTELLDGDLVPGNAERCFGRMAWALTQTPQVWLDCLVYHRADGVHMAWDAADQLFHPGMLDAMVELCENLLTAFADRPWSDRPTDRLPAEQRAARERVNATHRVESGKLLHQRFFDRAATDPEAPALITPDGILSRAEVADRSLRVAALLRSLGLREGEPVAVCPASLTDQIGAAIGVLAAGGCYVPIGPEQPRERRNAIYRTAGIRLAVTDDPPPRSDGPSDMVTEVTPAQAQAVTPLACPVKTDPAALAYIIFTSGSTGSPKGVEVTHRSAVNTIEDINERWSVGPCDRGIAISAMDFDLSVYEVFGLLGAGGAVVLPDATRDPQGWLDLIRRHRVTVWDSVPVLLDALITVAEEGTVPDSLRLVLTGGDWIGTDLPGRLHALVPDCLFVGCGGATEGSVYSNYFTVDRIDPRWPSVPYGYPLGNQRYRVVDDEGRDCPDWVTGELWIGGTGVARGYRNDPARTADRFVEHDGHRWYRTGDTGRYHPGGMLEFQGRTDHQVKINGYRIELGEVEAVVASHDQVAHAVAVVVGEGTGRRLIAYIVPAGEELDRVAVKACVESRLPEYARPAHYLALPDLPLTGNGKVDRRELAAWGAPVSAPAPAEPPREGVEQVLAEEWSALLPHPVHSRHERFFDLGGDSLRAMRLVTAINNRFHRRVSLRALLEAGTLAAMAALVSRDASGGPSATGASQ
ncbi:non-ribosomal peptide synthetase [Streptomyces alfalfae]|uniref:Amino acid adenylation domain-containing protein n=1 Tax=Streptomyces alfalfae TaxID=1642299 RepID=A0A7T4PLN2_9ACTN|nr:non-ribosomal peptide synthetase [Streptomyces alfalfae]QQC92406.1 amino acid adenylation domain-containing protein [Streptomyces alfalfae]